MNYYLKGYYGYKNFGDELLLLWLLPRVFKRYAIDSLYIEAEDPEWMAERLERHVVLLGEEILPKIHVIPKRNRRRLGNSIKLFGGGEVFTDARPFPHNWRNYGLWFFLTILKRKYHVLGGIGTVKNKRTALLYRFLLGRARSVTVRDETSLAVAKRFSSRVHLYHDFAEDVLSQLSAVSNDVATSSWAYHIINVNPYIRNAATNQKIQALYEKYPNDEFWYFPWELGSDDRFIQQITAIVPSIRIYNRTQYTVEEIRSFIAGAGESLAARLHILLCLHKAWVSYVPLVYQEKITKVLWVK